MTNNIEAKLNDAKITAKALCDFTWANACEVMENIIYLKYKYNTDFVFAFNNKRNVIAKGDGIRIESAAMAFDIELSRLLMASTIQISTLKTTVVKIV